MLTILTVHDQNSSGQKINTFTLECIKQKILVRELIRARIFQEVQDYNQKEPEYFRGLIEPTNAERMLDGYRLKVRRKIDWKEQYDRAIEAFGRNGFFILVGGKQVESLDQEFEVILMEPNDRYLGIVPDSRAHSSLGEKVFLPFEGDNMLAVILSKAFLLANDSKIKDPAILQQIRAV